MHKITAVMIDDDPMFTALMTSLMDRYDIEVHAFDVAETGLSYLTRYHPDIVFLDMVMPGQDGLDVLSRITHNPNLCELPVVVTSGVEDQQAIFKAVQEGAVGYLVKPFSEDDFLLKLAQALVVDIDELRARKNRQGSSEDNGDHRRAG